MDKTIINYSVGGLGNRLRPLASAHALAKLNNRKLLIYWDTVIPNGCLAKFNELFKNDIEVIDDEGLLQLESCKLFSGQGAESSSYQISKYGDQTLKVLVDKFGVLGCQDIKLEADNVIIHSNNFLPMVPQQYNIEFLQSLVPIDKIASQIETVVEFLGLSKNVIGVHARGTDFGTTVAYFIDRMRPFIEENGNQQFFISTEDEAFEDAIYETFPNHVRRRRKKHYITQSKDSGCWNQPDSFYITKEHAQEAVEDLFLLSKTNIQVFHPRSTFVEIARLL